MAWAVKCMKISFWPWVLAVGLAVPGPLASGWLVSISNCKTWLSCACLQGVTVKIGMARRPALQTQTEITGCLAPMVRLDNSDSAWSASGHENTMGLLVCCNRPAWQGLRCKGTGRHTAPFPAGNHGGNGGRAGSIEVYVSKMSSNFELLAAGGKGGKGQVSIPVGAWSCKTIVPATIVQAVIHRVGASCAWRSVTCPLLPFATCTCSKAVTVRLDGMETPQPMSAAAGAAATEQHGLVEILESQTETTIGKGANVGGNRPATCKCTTLC